jgi:hypothetical protein
VVELLGPQQPGKGLSLYHLLFLRHFFRLHRRVELVGLAFRALHNSLALRDLESVGDGHCWLFGSERERGRERVREREKGKGEREREEMQTEGEGTQDSQQTG